MFAAFFMYTGNVVAQSAWELGKLVPTAQVQDGMKVVLETACDATGLGSYLNSEIGLTQGIAAATVWTLEATGATKYTFTADGGEYNFPEYVLRSEATGQYLGYEGDRDATLYEYEMVDTKDAAHPFALIPASDPNFGPIENGHGVNWTDDSAVFGFIDQDGDLVFINTYWGSSVYCWPYRDTNPWNIYEAIEKTDGLSLLNALLISYGDNLDTYYKVGTDPGCINSQEVYENFYTVYQEALDAIQDGIATDEEANDIKARLIAAKEAADDPAVQNPMKEGYYYFITANVDFPENKAITATLGNDYATWNTFDETSLDYIWRVKEVDGGWSAQNVGSGLYLDKGTSTAASVNVKISSTFETPTVFNPITRSGEFHIADLVDYPDATGFPFHQGGHGNGSGVSGTIVLWKNVAGTGSSWFVRAVPENIVAEIENTEGLNRLQAQLDIATPLSESIGKNIGTEVGQWPADAGVEIAAAIEEASALVASGTNSERLEMAQKLSDAIDATRAKRVKPEDGSYYVFVSALAAYKEQQGVEKALYNNGSYMYWYDLDLTKKAYIYQASVNEDGSFYFKNLLTGLYAGKSSSEGASQTVYASSTPVPISITPYSDTTKIVKIIPSESAYQWHTAGHSGGAGSAGTIVNWNDGITSGSAWYVRKVDDATVMSLKLESIINKAEAKKEQAYAYDADYSSPAATSTSQLYSNNIEPTEGSYDALIDGNTDDLERDGNGSFPIFHSAWSNPTELEDAYHYLRIHKEDGLPEKFVIALSHRTGTGSHIRPREVVISVANDPEGEWTDLVTLNHNIDVVEPENDYVSPEINAGASYKYVKMTVVKTNGNFPQDEECIHNQLDTYGHPFFALTEFNVYPSKGLSPAAQVNDEEIKVKVDELEAVITKAKAALASNEGTDELIDEVQAAIDALNEVWKDTMLYVDKVAEVNIFKENLTAGTEVGQLPAEAIAEFEKAIEEPASISPVYKMSNSEMKAAIDKLEAALVAAKATMVMPDSKQWYFINSADLETTGGWFVMQWGRTAGSNMYNSNTVEDPGSHINNAWVLENDGAGKLYIRNTGSGFYQKTSESVAGGNIANCDVTGALPEGESFSLIPLGNEQFALKSNNGHHYIYSNASDKGNVTWQKPAVTDLTDTRFAFTIQAVAGAIDGETMPRPAEGQRVGSFAIYQTPTAAQSVYVPEEDTELKLYQITGKVEEDGYVKAIKLSEAEGGTIPAGKPYIVYAPGDYASGETTASFWINMLVDSEVAQMEDDSINGLIGLAAPRTILDETKAMFSGDSIAAVTTSTEFGNQRGYIDPAQITEVEGAANDLVVYLKGAGISSVVGLEDVVVRDNREIVNVYTIDGVLVKRNVARGAATNGLAKGIYIVGKDKVLVK